LSIYEIFAGEAGGTVNDCSEAVSSNNTMRLIVTVGWAIWSGLSGTLCNLPGSEGILNVVDNIADFVNKIGFVLSVWSAAKAESIAVNGGTKTTKLLAY